MDLSTLEMYVNHTILDYHKEGNWRKILELKKYFGKNLELEKFLWVWPGEDDLNFIKENVEFFQKDGIISLGCGCGLLEWIINEATGVHTIGYEVNKEWWTSKYSSPKFIDLNYVEMPPKCDILNENCALLFCYFNDGKAFLEYVKAYSGNLIFVIGPTEGAKKFTDPMPLKANFGNNSNFNLHNYKIMQNSDNVIAVYYKNEEQCKI